MKSYWIWSYGDYELYHANLVNSRRQEHGADYPAFWKYYDVDRNVCFFADMDILNDGYLTLRLHGKGYIAVDGKIHASDKPVKIKKGNHSFKISVCNLTGLPSAYIESDICATDKNWYTLNADCEKIPVGCEKHYNLPQSNPEKFLFSYKTVKPVNVSTKNGGILFDFGKEIFGYLNISNVAETDKIHVSYGESKEEATDTEYSILFEDISGKNSYKLIQRAFRYIFITGVLKADVYAELEYLPLEYRASFKCNDELVNKIWNVCAYTLHLNMREVLTEAIKRDRWLWAGDSYQAFKFNQYLFFDSDIVRRSLIGLRGKEPFNEHINTITDFSLYWVTALYEYYLTYQNIDFIKFMYPRAETLMRFCASRENDNGFIVGKNKDWEFIDWADIDKNGAVCAEQMLYITANNSMAKLAELLNKNPSKYKEKAKELIKKTNDYFWSEEKGGYIDCYESKKNHISRHANIFAVLFDIADEHQKESIINKVLLNDEIPYITTPFFKGFELDVMGKAGNFDFIENTIKSYWGDIINLGATTVWEEYNSKLSGIQHYSMYGDKYAKSLCHAWGASPIYLLGKYFAGVEITETGFKVKPHLGNFEWFDAVVPVRGGEVKIKLDGKRLCISSTAEGGTVIWKKEKHTIPSSGDELVLN